MKETHKFTSDEKLLWLGYGEWVEEPDLVEFEHCGLKCKIVRQVHKELDTEELHVFGGFLTGYVSVDKDHPFYGKGLLDQSINKLEVHGGVTFNDFKDDDLYWIGFDCAHLHDINPSMQILYKEINEDIKKSFSKISVFNPTYKNISFAIGECKSLAEQLSKIQAENE